MRKLFLTNYWLLVLFLFAVSCTQEEYMPPEVGEAIPFDDTIPTETFSELLKNSPYTLFYQIWQKSTFAEQLEATSDRYTVLAIDNTCLENVGWNASTIAAGKIQDLDTLLMQQVFSGMITEKNLREKEDNYQAFSLLEHPGLLYHYSLGLYSDTDFDTYRYQAFFAIEDGKLLVNGIPMIYQTPLLAHNGIMWPVDQIWKLPTQTAWEYIKHDPRFSMYVGILEYTDNRYHQMFFDANGYYPWQGQIYAQFNERTGYGLRTWKRPTDSTPCIDILGTYFVPTNDAFHQAGFNNLQDLIAFNERRKEPYTEWFIPMANNGFYTIRGGFATDTLLNYHHEWGLRCANFGNLNPLAIRYAYWNLNSTAWSTYNSGTYAYSNLPVIYSNDLRNELLEKKVIYDIISYGTASASVVFGLANKEPYYVPFKITKNNSTSSLSVKESDAEPAILIDKDITTLNGVIHVVDKLLIPPGFSIN